MNIIFIVFMRLFFSSKLGGELMLCKL
jgi:hypothetical protein